MKIKSFEFNLIRPFYIFVISDHVHAKCTRPIGQDCADAAYADQTERLAHQLRTFQLFLFPFACYHGIVCFDDPIGYTDHERKGEFCHSNTRSFRGVVDSNALFLCIIQIHIVQTHTTADDEF